MLIIANPGSAAGRSMRRYRAWCADLQAAGVPFDAVFTDGPGHARDLAQRDGAHDTIVAAGGDGTINQVLDGILQSGRQEVRFGVLYAGTSPDFCRFHGIPTAPEQALATLVHGGVSRVDAVRIRGAGSPDGDRFTAHFACGCNIGLGAAVAAGANALRPLVGDKTGTVLALIHAVVRSQPTDLCVSMDGDEVDLRHTNHLMVLKNPFIASGLRLDLPLEPADGRLHVVAVHGRSRLGLLGLIPGFYNGRAAASAGLFTRSCVRVNISARRPVEVEFDGDPHGFLPVDIDVLPRVLSLIGGGGRGPAADQGM